MKFLSLLTVLVVGLAFSSNAMIATVDTQSVINNSNAAKRAVEILKSKTEKSQAKINEMEATIEKSQKDLKRRKAMLSRDKFMDAEAELRASVREFRNEVQKIQEDLDRDNMRLRKEITDEVRSVVESIAKERSYEAVVAKNLLLYSDESIDISDEVLKRVNKNLSKRHKK